MMVYIETMTIVGGYVDANICILSRKREPCIEPGHGGIPGGLQRSQGDSRDLREVQGSKRDFKYISQGDSCAPTEGPGITTTRHDACADDTNMMTTMMAMLRMMIQMMRMNMMMI